MSKPPRANTVATFATHKTDIKHFLTRRCGIVAGHMAMRCRIVILASGCSARADRLLLASEIFRSPSPASQQCPLSARSVPAQCPHSARYSAR